MVAIKNPTYVGKGPGVPTTPVPSYKATAPADPYYPKGTMGLAADEAAAPAAAPPKAAAKSKPSPDDIDPFEGA